ncbi:MAG: oligosaccharide flippase family protein [Methylococcaceae bacterium]
MASLKKNIGASFVGNVVYAVSQWLLLIALAKMGGERVLGVYALALAVVSPVFALGNMNLRAVQATDAKKSVSFSSYAQFRQLFSLVSILICISIAAAIYQDKLDICLAIVCMAFYKYFESKSDLVHGFLQQRERMNLIAHSTMVRGIGNVLIVASMYYLTGDLVQALAVSIFKSWVVYYFVDRRNYRRLYQEHDNNDQLKTKLQLFSVAWPLGIVVFANTLNLNIPRYFIAEYYGEAMVGIFASISYFIVAGSTLVNAIGQSAVPRLAKYACSDYAAFRQLSRKMFLLITLVGMIGVLITEHLGEFILQQVYTSSIAAYSSLFVQIMWAGLAVYASTAFGCSLTALRDFKSQSIFAIVNMLVMLASSWWLINDYGLAGAAGAIGLTYTIKLMINWLRVRYVLSQPLEVAP